jgi:hypothetical protein
MLVQSVVCIPDMIEEQSGLRSLTSLRCTINSEPDPAAVPRSQQFDSLS